MGARGGAAVIANGGTRSNVIQAQHIWMLAVQAPATIDALNYKVQGTVDGVNWQDIPNGTMDAASEIVTFETFPWTAFSILASGAVGAERSFAFSSNS